jgi:hypothetical protein
MRLTFLIVSALLGSGSTIFGDSRLATTSAAALDNINPNSPGVRVVERGQDFTRYASERADSAVGSVTTGVTGATGFTLLENGLNYLENGQYLPSEDIIESFPEGAVARHGPVRGVFSPDLNTQAVFDLQAPNGARLRGGVRSLHLTDSSTGRSILLGTVRQNVPAELQPPNQVIYRDAFDGLVQADVVLTWKHNAFSQDVDFSRDPSFPLTSIQTPRASRSPPSLLVQPRRESLRPPIGEQACQIELTRLFSGSAV